MKEDNDSGGKSSAKKRHCSAFILLHCVRHYRPASKTSMDLGTASETAEMFSLHFVQCFSNNLSKMC